MNLGNSLPPPALDREIDLDYCLAPIGVQEFIAKYWEREILHCSRNDRQYFAGVFGMKDLDPYLNSPSLSAKEKPVLVANAQKAKDAPKVAVYRTNGTVDVNAVQSAYRGGYTVILNEMKNYWPPIAALCQNFERTFQHQVGANLYLTPQKSQGFLAHYDTHEVFVLQLSGSKLWRIYHQEIELPLEGQFTALDQSKLPSPTCELLLQPGDLLYIPRGRVHAALSTDTSSSMHLTVGIHPTRWLDLVNAAVKHFTLNNPRLRESVPMGEMFSQSASVSLSEELQRVLEVVWQKANTKEALVSAQRDLFLSMQAPSIPAASEAGKAGALLLQTSLINRHPQACVAAEMDGAAAISFPGRCVTAPLSFLPLLEFIASRKRFALADSSSELDPADRLIMAERLLEAGLLAVDGS